MTSRRLQSARCEVRKNFCRTCTATALAAEARAETLTREEELSRLFADAVKRVQVPADVADWIAEALRESRGDKERFHRTAVMQL